MRNAVLAAVMSLGMTPATAASSRPDLPSLPMPASVAPSVGGIFARLTLQ